MSTHKNAYFAAANTARGFESFFDQIFAHGGIERRYIIKGGPGTGKSSFMRRVALAAQREGGEVEYYYCSSDTESLDGIIIDGKLAILDGTAPHACDVTFPGVRDGIIDLGRFWNEDLLKKNERPILELSAQKARAYRTAYSFLGAAGKANDAIDGILSECLLHEKMQKTAIRLLSRLGVPRGSGTRRIRQVSALGTHGHVCLDTLGALSRRTLCIYDYYGVASTFLSLVADAAIGQGVDVDVSIDPISPDTPNEIYFPTTADRIVICSDGDGEGINTKRFVDAGRISEVRRLYRAAKKARDSLVDLALDSLATAGRVHAQIEKYYIEAMDFDRQTRYCEQFIEQAVLTGSKKCDII